MMNPTISDFKKRLMFLKGEDLYFLTYNTLILLDAFSCNSQNKPLLDHTKIAFLLEFVADSRLAKLIASTKKDGCRPGAIDKQQLQAAYTEGLMRKHIISRLVFALEKKGLISLKMNTEKGVLALWLNPGVFPQGFFQTELYEPEFQNASAIRGVIPRLRTMTVSTLLCRLFSENGVQIWHI